MTIKSSIIIIFPIILKLNTNLQLIAYGELMMHGHLAAKLVEVLYKLEHEKWTNMLKMVERHVLVFPLSNKSVIQTHALPLMVSLLFFFF